MKTLHETKEKCKQKKLKTWNKPGSSHPYTQRQLVLERKLKSTCPQVRPFTHEHSVKTGYNFSKHREMHFCAMNKKIRDNINFNLSIKQSRVEFTKAKFRTITLA